MKAGDVRKLSRRLIRLPALGVEVEVRAYRVREMLMSGMAPVIRFSADSEHSQEEADRIVKQAGEVLCACSVTPKVVPHDNPDGDEISLEDIPIADVLFAFKEIIKLSQSRFYGINRTAYDPDKEVHLFEGQKRIAIVVDAICQRYGLSPLEVERWSDEELSKVLAIIEVSEAEKARVRKDAE